MAVNRTSVRLAAFASSLRLSRSSLPRVRRRRRRRRQRPPRPPTGDVQQGGTLVVGAEQEPDCADWIASCAGSSWGTWTMQVTTLPRPFNIVKEGGDWVYEPSDLLDRRGRAEDRRPKQVVTYKINPKAVWSDGTQDHGRRTSSYTWDQIANGNDIYDKTGYADIESVDATDPAIAGRHVQEGATPTGRASSPATTRVLPVAPAEGQGPQQGDGERLHVLRWPVEDRVVAEGHRRRRSSATTRTGAPRPSSTRSSSGSSPTPRPSSRRSRRARRR